MAEDRVDPREGSLSQRLPWLTIFQGFRIALDFNKLILAAAGIVVMAFGWWLLAVIFKTSEPEWDANRWKNWAYFKEDHQAWALRYQAAGNPNEARPFSPADFARDADEHKALKDLSAFKPDAAEKFLIEKELVKNPEKLTDKEKLD